MSDVLYTTCPECGNPIEFRESYDSKNQATATYSIRNVPINVAQLFDGAIGVCEVCGYSAHLSAPDPLITHVEMQVRRSNCQS